MCGIFGIIGFEKKQLELARKALHTLNHRGPDQWGDWHGDHIYLGHRRLSIIDLSENGRQPMHSADGRVTIAVNGEIYNYRALREQLRAKYPFRSESDSEVILHGYRQWGIDGLLERLDGMFAFVIYDRERRLTYLVRDRFGKKPLFYVHWKDQWIFASEIKAIFEFAPELKVFSWRGVKDWLYHRGNLSPDTIYHRIVRLLPGRYARISDGKLQNIQYYDLLHHLAGSDPQSNAEEVLVEMLDQAVSKRLMSDVPVGLQLSGGVDSSLIAYFIKKNHSGRMHSFSIGFQGPEFQGFSEESFARQVAAKLGYRHHQINLSSREYLAEFDHTVRLFDGMLDYPNAIAIYLLSKYSKEFITVALTGEGADEIFGGYLKFRNMLELAERKRRPPFFPEMIARGILGQRFAHRLRNLYLARHYGGNPRRILEDLNCYIAPDTFTRIFGPREDSLFDYMDYREISRLPFYKQLILVDHKTYLFSLLDRQDRASMGASVEARLPFLDQRLIEWVVSLDQRFLFDTAENKRLLKQLSSRLFGEKFTYRPKMGFPIPISIWFDQPGEFRERALKIFDDDFVLNEKLNRRELRRYLGSGGFDRKLLNYSDSDKMWLKWFLMVLRSAQDNFGIDDIK